MSGSEASVRLPVAVDAVAVARLLAREGRSWFWFDGLAAPGGEPRTSYLGVASETREVRAGGEAAWLETLPVPAGATPTARIPVGFAAGWVVALSYEFGGALLAGHPHLAPDAAGEVTGLALRCDAVLAIDHGSGVAELRGDPGAIAEWRRKLEAEVTSEPSETPSSARAEAPVAHARWRRDDARYLADVDACRQAIRDGNAYVLCLTDTAEVRGEFDPLATYLTLRHGGVAARGGVIATHERALVSISPERFLSVHGTRVATHPIKGTRRRGASAHEDDALIAELIADPKERAENLMIVDLMRNDLSRICRPGSVGVDGFLRVETHPHVHQLVSTVTGELRPGLGIADALTSCFPGGSMTGAPKASAVQILAALERHPRGLYAGCFGWIDASGDAELAMTIRSIEMRDPGSTADQPEFRRALVGAGGGITADSDPSREVAEKHLKASAVLAALRAQATTSR